MVEPQLYPRVPKNKRASRRHQNEDMGRRCSMEGHRSLNPRDSVNCQSQCTSTANPVRTSSSTIKRSPCIKSTNTYTTADVSAQTESSSSVYQEEDEVFHDAPEVQPHLARAEPTNQSRDPAGYIDVVLLNAVLDSCIEEIGALREELEDVYKQRREAHAEFARVEALLFEVLGIAC